MSTDRDTSHSAHAGQMERAYAHYIGRPPDPLTTRSGQSDDNLIISLGRLVVDKGASFLFGEQVAMQVPEPEPEPKQDWLDECWRRNKRATTLLKLATNGGIFGHAFVRILDTKPFPRVVVLDPQIIGVVTDPDDIDTVWQYTITPRPIHVADDEDEGTELPRRTVIYSPSGKAGRAVDAQTPWTIVDQQLASGNWITVEQEDWPYDFCPIVHCQNLPRPNDFWGESDLPEDVLKILDAINRVASHYNKIIRLHAHPRVWARGMGATTIDTAIDSVIMLPSETAQLAALEMQSDLGSTMAFLEKLLALLSYMVRIPMVAMGEPDNLGAISGVALQIRYQPLVEKTTAKRMTYGDLLVELDRCLLAMSGLAAGGDVICHISWPELLPSDPLQERQTWILDESLGLVSKETLSGKAGYSFEEEQEKLADEKQAAIAAGLEPAPVPPVQGDGETVPPPEPFGGPATSVEPKMSR